MEDHQSKQQQSSEEHLKLPRRDRRSRPLVALLKRHPWLLWSGIWILLLSAAAFMSSIAIFSLTHTGRIAHQEPQQPAVAAENPAPAQTTSVTLLWLGAVALTFTAAGYLIISKRFSSLSQSVKHSAPQVPTRRQRRHLLHELPPLPSEPTPITPPVPDIEPLVTVLPPEQSHPLDAGEESLAEMMDIRKHRPLSSILGETFIEK